MSQITETICDQCGAHKGKSNNWFRSLVTGNFISFRRWDSIDSADSQEYKDICSENCASKALSEFTKPTKGITATKCICGIGDDLQNVSSHTLNCPMRISN